MMPPSGEPAELREHGGRTTEFELQRPFHEAANGMREITCRHIK